MQNRRKTVTVQVGEVRIGSDYPVRLQSMASVDTLDTERCVDQALRIVAAGGELVRYTSSSVAQSENLSEICSQLRARGCNVPIIADVHFNPVAAFEAAARVQKVRINPGNFSADGDAKFISLLEICRQHGTALRIGVNHGSLSQRIMEQFGDTPEGMVESAMEYLRVCRAEHFDNVVVSMKSSNVGVMVLAYRLLVVAMEHEQLNYPLHLGVTEAGDGEDGRIKSAVGIGTLLSEGIGDTVRVSLTEAPENEIPVARKLVNYINSVNWLSVASIGVYDRQATAVVGEIGGEKPVVVLSANDIIDDEIIVVDSREALAEAVLSGTCRPIILKRSYAENDLETLQIKAACDFGALLLAGFGNGILIENHGTIAPESISSLAYGILQATRVRITKTEYIACPGCGRTLFDLPGVLHEVRKRTSHLTGLKIAVMGCIVNGPGEMADADYGYVGAGRGKVSLYRGKDIIERDIPQEEAIDRLLAIIE